MRNNRRNTTAKLEKIRMLKEKENHKYLGILEADTIRQAEMKEKIRKNNHRRTKRLLETRLCSKNFIKGINTWAVPLVNS